MKKLRFSKSFASIFLLTVCGAVFGLALCEMVLRTAGISYPVFDTYDELRGVALRPGKEGWYRKEGKAYLQINSLGYRDVEHRLEKQVNTFRVAVLGDSFAEARQVSLKDTFWSHLGHDLGGCPALAGKQVEVLNFGVGGYATTGELLTLRKDVLQFSPDLVLLAFYAGNDVQDNSKELSQESGWRMPQPVYVYADGELVLDNSFRQSTSRRFLYEGVHHFRSLELLNEVRRIWTVRKMIQDGGQANDNFALGTTTKIYVPPDDEAWRTAWLVTEALLARMNNEVKASGARFVVTTVTMSDQVHPDPALRAAVERRLGIVDLLYPDRKIVEMGQKHGFPVITLAEPLQLIATRDRVYLHGFKNTVMGQGHWNESGHRLAGSVLAQDICGKVLTAGY